MISVQIEDTKSFLNSVDFSTAVTKSNESFTDLKNKTGKGTEWLGWRTIIENPNDALLNDIEKVASTIRKDADIFIVCGIGGSYLGSKAVIDALVDERGKNKIEILYVGHHMSGAYLSRLVDYISEPKSNGKKKSVYLNVISKSGTTI